MVELLLLLEESVQLLDVAHCLREDEDEELLLGFGEVDEILGFLVLRFENGTVVEVAQDVLNENQVVCVGAVEEYVDLAESVRSREQIVE